MKTELKWRNYGLKHDSRGLFVKDLNLEGLWSNKPRAKI
jgi:hypothetical protein